MQIGLKKKEKTELALVDCGWLPVAGSPATRVTLLRSEDALSIEFRVDEANPRITCRSMNEPVFTDSCVEFFVQPLAQDGAPYINFEMNAAGILLLQKGTSRGNRPFLTLQDLDGITLETGSGTDAKGAFWSLVLTVPFAWFEHQVPGFKAVSGTEMRANFYKCGDKTETPHYASWNPMTAPHPDFHRPVDFGSITLL